MLSWPHIFRNQWNGIIKFVIDLKKSPFASLRAVPELVEG
jgi:hypothetical protein